MYLKELTINGFKSFAKKGELEFSAQITAIVGPNGSGKSNVAEAFRFVLGEQSPSKMRGKKGEDLIFNGSTTTSRANRASVLISLNNDKRVFPLDFDEVSIERIVHRDGVNEYLINGSKTRLKDVQELLAAANIGSTGHHIISQGEADRILSASPRERREMIEDALGLKIFQYKKAESERKLKKTVENVAQVESLRREVAPHLKFLERQVKKLERSLELQEQLKLFYSEYLRREDTYIAFHHDRLLAEKRVPEEKLEALSKELIKAKEQLEKEEKDDTRDALVALEADIATLRTKRQDVLREGGKIEGQVTFLKRRIEERTQKRDSEQAPIPYETVEKTVSQFERATEKALLSDDVGPLRHAIEIGIKTFRALLEGGARADTDTRAEEEELTELLKAEAESDKKLTLIEGEEQELNGRYEAMRAKIEEGHSASREAEREVFRIMNEQREAEQKLMFASQELKTLERDRDEFKRELLEAATLVGMVATRYFEHAIVVEGKELTKEDIVAETRDEQRERKHTLEKLKIRLEELGAGSTDEVMKEFKDVKERDEFLVREIDDLNQSVAKLEALIADLTEQLNEQFAGGIEKIAAEFNRLFELMFGGGEAKLVLVKPKVRKKKDEEELDGEDLILSDLEPEEEDVVEEGIDIDVKLPNKRVRGLDMLSGGERALTSIALIFAMSQVNPPLFVILDETDAALDEANSKRYGDMIEALAKQSQLILITHNRETMGRAGVLYGVTMGGDGISKLLSVKFDEAVAVAK